MKRLKNIGKNLALSVASLALCFILTELALKIAGYGDLEVYDWDPAVYWKLRPNQNCYTKINHQPVHVNSHGVRGPEFAIPKPPGVIRILSLGDSTGFGWGLSDEQTYSRLLEKQLNASIKTGPRFEVINAGCNAYGYPQLKSFFIHHGLAFQPDYVLIGGANLWTDFTEDASEQFKSAMRRRIFLKNLSRRLAIYHFFFESQFGGLYHKYRTRFIPVDPNKDKIFTSNTSDPLAFFEKSLRELFQAVQTNHIAPVIINTPVDQKNFTNQTFVDLLAMRKRVANEMNVPIVDLDTPDWPPAQKNVYLEGDYVHLNALGNQIVADHLTERFIHLVRK
jgi:lysophospholipase L1-like esterase